MSTGIQYLLVTAAGVGGSTLFGYILGYFIKDVPHKVNDTILGLCAGIMMAAAIMGLIVPAMDSYGGFPGKIIPIAGVFIGALFLTFIDRFTPHLHRLAGLDNEAHANDRHLDRILLFVLAIAIHKFPEGMSAGVGFAGGGAPELLGSAVSVAIGISIQNIPEGMVIVSPLLLAGVSRRRTLVIALAISALEVAGVFTGYLLGSISEFFLPFMLAFSGGAMLYVVSDEMIPESHAHGYQKPATFALIAGFIFMLLI